MADDAVGRLAQARLVLASASVVTATSAATLSLIGSGRLVLVALAAAQTLGVVWLFVEGWSSARQWASATCILASAWAPLFLVASWVYAVDPGLLADVASSPEPALTIMNLALFSLIAAWLALGGRGAVARIEAPFVVPDAQRLNRRWLAVWMATGILGLAAFLALAGGPLEYISDFDRTGARSGGLTYVIWIALAVKFAALVVLAHHWATGEGRRRTVVALVTGAVILLSLFGQRAFIALMLAQIILLYALIKRRISVRLVAPLALVLLFVVTFGLGTLKRYQNYVDTDTSGEDLSFVDYVEKRAAGEAVQAYVGNYADGVRLTAQVRALVPEQADYEMGRGFVRLALQPIPSFVRPKVQVAGPLRPILEVNRGYSHALPIPLVTYVEFGLIGVVLGGVVVGLSLIVVDRQLAIRNLPLTRLLVVVAAAVQIPFCLRTGLPRGVALAALDLLGMWIVARTSLRGPAKDIEAARTSDEGVAGVSRA